MPSFTEVVPNEAANTLPTVICNNPRELIEPEEVSLSGLTLNREVNIRQDSVTPFLPTPVPRYPLEIVCSPDMLHFQIEHDVVINKLRIWNSCAHSIYVHYCGLWDETAALGAGWHCYPRTRFLLAPGLKAELFISATPRLSSPVPFTYACLQLAAAYMRDQVTGYFAVPMQIKFLNYVAPIMCEGE